MDLLPHVLDSALLASAPDFAQSFGSGGAGAYATAFVYGVLVDLTPCVFPLIPITVAVFGAKGVSRARALLLATAYVLGMATLYTSLGVVVALTGNAFGAWLANPWVVVPIALLLVALAASMFGAFDLQLPTSMQNRLNAVGGAGPMGAFLMGLVSGFISAPCTGPVLLSLLAMIAKAAAEGGGIFYGGSLLFTYALGMGTLFFAVALGASLFRPGAWMEYVKSFFGVLLIVMALWFLRPLSSSLENFILDPSWGFWVAVTAVLIGVGLGAIHLSFHGPTGERFRKALAVGLTVFGTLVAVNNLVYVPPANWHQVTTVAQLEAEITAAEAEGKPLLIDFAATWCNPCKEMELSTFHHETVEPLLSTRFHLVKIDVTEGTDEHGTMQDAFASATLPSVLVYPSSASLSQHLSALREGKLMPQAAAHFHEVVEAEEFLEAIEPIE
ncbi:protein-disulfide reductase DsbD family protein [Paraliomyxa miuraensis]|uniref:protein-disulfide reductase DsbD family protein n=1 Tax=Paraliomyxa miuraensis TaxID=376150 RepID=UPI0022529B0F|nr:cytochrome c biogenesis protein CcdA [Paraliomyxa miuraensis]MCX4244451.1 thioredoxin family protein [Paraliomyxa miuraensis]